MTTMKNQVLEGLFKGTQLVRARRALGWSERDLARELGLPLALVESWETGTSTPEPEQFEALVDRIGVPDRFFLTITPDTPTGAFFRGLRSVEPVALSPASRKTLATFHQLCEYQAHLEEMVVRRPPATFPDAVSTNPETAAREVRVELGLDIKPVSDLDDVLLRLGIKLFRLEIPGEEFSGLSEWSQDWGPSALADARHASYRQRFTFAHEFGHLLRNRQGLRDPVACDLDWDKDLEGITNRFAAAFLVPATSPELRDLLLQHPDPCPTDLDPLCGYFGVSREVLARRLEGLEMASWSLVQSVRDARLPEPKPSLYRRRAAAWKRRLNKRYLNLGKRAYQQGKISLGKLAELLQVDPETALVFASGEE